MKEHPIPQDITSYRFHIVGSMTLKQFGEVGAGMLIAFLIYQTNLISIIKWPLVGLFGIGGIAAAFIPIEERPLSHWIVTFFSILYKPTQFFWRRAYNIPAPFLFVGHAEDMMQLQEIDLTPARRQRIKEFLSSTHTQTDDTTSPEEYEKINSIMSIFQNQQAIITEQHEVVAHKPNLTLRVRSIRQIQTENGDIIVDPNRPAVNSLDPNAAFYSTSLIEDDTPHFSADKKNTYLNTDQVAQTLQVPENNPVKLEAKKVEAEEIAALTRQQESNTAERAFVANAAQRSEEFVDTAQARFNKALPFPALPTVPNKLVGMVLTQKDELIPGAIVEIKTPEGHVTRAVKTNALGQFFITTPLANGDYVVSVEKESYEFIPLAIKLEGEIVEPIEVRSR